MHFGGATGAVFLEYGSRLYGLTLGGCNKVPAAVRP